MEAEDLLKLLQEDADPLSPAEMEQCKHLFDVMDKDDTQELEADEIEEFFEAVDPGLTRAEAKQLAAVLDTDKSGTVSFEELLPLLKRVDLSTLGMDHLRLMDSLTKVQASFLK